jgi:transposase
LRAGGRPRVNDRKCLEAIFWSVRTGRSLRHAPPRFGRCRTSQRRFVQWSRWGILEKAWARYLHFTGLEERQEWRRALAGGRGFWQITFRLTLEIEWKHDPPPEKIFGVWE